MYFYFDIHRDLIPVSNVLFGRVGYINSRTGEEPIFKKYDEAQVFSERMAVLKYENKFGYIDYTGRESIPNTFDKAEAFANGYAIVKVDRKSGAIDMSGKMVIPAKYEHVEQFKSGLARVWRDSFGNMGFVNLQGSEVIPTKYTFVSEFHRGFAKVCEGGKLLLGGVDNSLSNLGSSLMQGEMGKWGVIDEQGSIVVPLKYDSIIFENNPSFGEGGQVFFVKSNKRWQLLLQSGKLLSTDSYDDISLVYNSGFIVKQGGKTSYIKYDGRPQFNFQYDSVTYCGNGFFAVFKNGKGALYKGILDQLTYFRYENIGEFTDGTFKVVVGDKCGFINEYGKEITGIIYDVVSGKQFFKDARIIKINGRFGIIDKTGKLLTDTLYDEIRIDGDSGRPQRYSDGIGIVRIGGKYDYINMLGQRLTDISFDGASGFYDGHELARIVLNEKVGFINKSGTIVFRAIYDAGSVYWNNTVELVKNGKTNYYREDGTCLTNCPN